MANENGIELIFSETGGQEVAKVTNVVADAVVRVGESYQRSAGPAEEFEGLIKGLTKSVEANTTATQANTKVQQEFVDMLKAVATSAEQGNAALEQSSTVRKENTVIIRDEVKELQADNIALQENIKLLEEDNLQLASRVRALEAATVAQKTNTAAASAGNVAAKDAAAGISKVYDKLGTIGRMGTPAVLRAGTWSALALGGIAYESVKQFTSLNAELTQSITQAGRAANSMPFLQQTALDIAKKTGVSFSDVGNMIYRVASATAGWNNGLGSTNQQLAQMTRQVANLNVLGGVAGGAPAEQAARVLGAVANANLSDVGRDPTKAAALINAGTGAGDIKQSELISALGRGLLASAAAHNVSGASAISFVDLLTTLGTPGSTAGQYAKTALTLMTAPSSQGAKAMAMVGIAPGQINTLLSGPGGIVAAAGYLKQALERFNPTAFNSKYKGATGAPGATALLENWGVGNIPAKVIAAWAAGGLEKMTAAQLGTEHAGANGKAVSGADWLNTLQQLIITKAYGGSRSSATINALLNQFPSLQGIYSYVQEHSTASVYDAAVKRAESTPQAQFKQMKQSILADFVSIGQTLTPWALHLGNALKDLVGAITKYKPILLGVVGALGSFIALAMFAKTAQLLRGGARLLGGGYNMFGGFWSRRAMAAEEAGNTRRGAFYTGLGSGGTKVRAIADAYEKESVGLLKQIAVNTARAAEEGLMGGGPMGRGVKAAEGEAVAAAESGAMYGPQLSEVGMHGPFLSETRNLSKMEEYAMMNPGKRIPRVLKKELQAADRAAAAKGAAFAERSAAASSARTLAAGESMIYAPGLKTGVIGEATQVAEKGAVVGLEKAAPSIIGRVAGSALGFLGGPVGMMAMSMLLPMAMPYIGKAISGIGGFLGGLFGSHNGTNVVTTGGTTKTGVLANQTALQGEIIAGQQQMAAYEKEFASGNYKNLSKYEQLKANMAIWTNQQNYYTGAGGGLNKTGLTAAKNQATKTLTQLAAFTTLSSAVNKTVKNEENLSESDYKKLGTTLKTQLKKAGYTGPVAKAIMQAYQDSDWTTLQADIAGTKTGLFDTASANRIGVNAVDKHFFDRTNANNLVYNQTHFGANKATGQTSDKFNQWILGQRVTGLKGQDQQTRYLQLMNARNVYLNEAHIDAKLAANSKLGSTAQKTYNDAVTKLEKEAREFNNKAVEVKNQYRFHPADMKTLANLISQASKVSMSELGMTSAGMQQAFTAALGPGGMAAFIAKINKAVVSGTA